MALSRINTNQIVDGAVATADIADGLITTAKLADGAVTTAKVADDAVTNAKVADNAVANAQLADNAVGTNEIADDAVTTAKVNPAQTDIFLFQENCDNDKLCHNNGGLDHYNRCCYIYHHKTPVIKTRYADYPW